MDTGFAFKPLDARTCHPAPVMTRLRMVVRPCLGVLAALMLGGGARAEAEAAGGASVDPLAGEIERWANRLAAETSALPLWADVKAASAPALESAGQALRDGHRSLALLRLAAARENLAAASFLLEQPESMRKDQAAFEAEWEQAGLRLREARGPLSAAALAGVEPAVVRALAEAALPQVRVYYDASLEYGRNTMPDSGLFYLGAAQAQRDFVAFLRTLRGPGSATGRARPCRRSRSLGPSSTRSRARCSPPTGRPPRSTSTASSSGQRRPQGGARARRGRPAPRRAAALPAGGAALRAVAAASASPPRPAGRRAELARLEDA